MRRARGRFQCSKVRQSHARRYTGVCTEKRRCLGLASWTLAPWLCCKSHRHTGADMHVDRQLLPVLLRPRLLLLPLMLLARLMLLRLLRHSAPHPRATFLRTRDLISENIATCSNEESQGHVIQQEPAVALCASGCTLLAAGRCLLLHDTSCLRARLELPLLLNGGAACCCPACLSADVSLRPSDPQSWSHRQQRP